MLALVWGITAHSGFHYRNIELANSYDKYVSLLSPSLLDTIYLLKHLN